MLYLVSIVALSCFVLTCGAIALLFTAPRRRSMRVIGQLALVDDDRAFMVFGHDPFTGRGASTPIFTGDRTVGTLSRLVRSGQLEITAVEPFDRAEPRHVQSLRGVLAVLDLEISERESTRVDALSRRAPGVDDLLRLAQHHRLHRLAVEGGLLDSLVSDGGRTLAMPAFEDPEKTSISA